MHIMLSLFRLIMCVQKCLLLQSFFSSTSCLVFYLACILTCVPLLYLFFPLFFLLSLSHFFLTLHLISALSLSLSLSFFLQTYIFSVYFFLNNYLLQQFSSYFCRNTNNETKDGIVNLDESRNLHSNLLKDSHYLILYIKEDLCVCGLCV